MLSELEAQKNVQVASASGDGGVTTSRDDYAQSGTAPLRRREFIDRQGAASDHDMDVPPKIIIDGDDEWENVNEDDGYRQDGEGDWQDTAEELKKPVPAINVMNEDGNQVSNESFMSGNACAQASDFQQATTQVDGF